MMDAPDFIEPSAEATLRPPGIYFGLPEDEYLADPGLGSTDARRINISPLDWWWTSSHGPEHEVVTESAAQALGTALHCYILEGEAAFEQRYLIAPEKTDDMLVTVEDLRAVLRDAGEKMSGNKSDLIDRVLDIDPKARIWDVILAAHDDECLTSNRTSINASTVQDARIRDRIIKATPEISARVTGGYPEVSIFWEANGVRWKARVDYLRTTDQTDLKSFANKNGGTIDDVITRAVASSKLHVQARLHWEGVQAAKEMLRTFGPACAHGDFDTEWLREFAKSPPGDFWWLFVQSKGAPVAAARTCPRSVKGDHSDIWQDAWWQIEAAARSFIANRDRFGMDQPWIDTAPVKRLADGDFPPWTIG